MAVGAEQRPLTLAGLPAGVLARPLQNYRPGPDGDQVAVRTRRGLRKLERVELVPDGDAVPVGLDTSEERWVLGAGTRRWSSIQQRYRDNAWDRAVELVRAGVVHVRCEVDDALRLGRPFGWVLTDHWAERRAGIAEVRADERDHWAARARAVAAAVRDESPELADAVLAAPAGASTSQVLVCAAEDLVEGVVSSGPRGFSQAHFGDSKAHDDVATVLRNAGVDDDILIRLGVRRSARLGVAGPVSATVNGRAVDLAALDGPVLVRADQAGLCVRLERPVPVVIVENLQAAETLADQVPDAAIIYTAGLLGQAALAHIRRLTQDAVGVVLVPDADLGGVRIAEQVLAVAPAARLIDIGAMPHTASRPWPATGVSARGLEAARGGVAGVLARACAARGYPVEQELATVDAVRAALAADHGSR